MLQVNGKYIVKSGTDFRQFSHITLSFTTSGVTVNIVEVNVTSAFEEDKELKELLLKYKGETSLLISGHIFAATIILLEVFHRMTVHIVHIAHLPVSNCTHISIKMLFTAKWRK